MGLPQVWEALVMIRQSRPATSAGRVQTEYSGGSQGMQNPPPPPPPSGGPPPMMPPPPSGGGMPPMMPPGGGGAMAVPGNLASPGMRIVGGLIDVVILAVVNGIISTILQKATGLAGLINIVIDVAYFGYFWSSRGASIGMMPFGFKVR